MNERDLVRGLRSTDEKVKRTAFVALCEQDRDRLSKLAARMLRRPLDDHSVMQAVNETLMKVWLTTKMYDPDHPRKAKLPTWLGTIMNNVCKDIRGGILKTVDERQIENIDFLALGKPNSGRPAAAINGEVADVDENLDYFLALDESPRRPYFTRPEFKSAKELIRAWFEKLSARDQEVLIDTIEFEYVPLKEKDGDDKKWQVRQAYTDSEILDNLCKRFHLTRANVRKIKSNNVKKLIKILQDAGYTILEEKAESRRASRTDN